MLTQKEYKLILMLLIACLISLPLFIHLDRLPIRIWDESRLAVNAFEMQQNGNYIVTHYEGEPDMWNTKPPLMIWAQVAFMKVLGVNELAVRMPAALAALLTCLLLVCFSKKAFNSYSLGALAALVLVTTNGYVENHVSRSGDYDALLILFTSIYCLSMFLYVEKGGMKYFHLFFAALTLAVLTKSIQGLLFLPAIGLYILIQKKHLQVLQNKWFYIDTAVFLAFSCGYFLLRDSVNPGYLQAVWENDFGGRFSNDLVEGGRDGWFYLSNLISHDFTYWFLFACVGYFLAFRSQNSQLKAFSLYSLLLVTFYFLIISTAQTKLHWYSAPVYPLLCLIAAVTLYQVGKLLQTRFNTRPILRYAPLFFLSGIFIYPYQHIIRKTYRPSEEKWDQDLYPISNLLQEASGHSSLLANHLICYEDYNAQILFYVKNLNAQGKKISFVSYDQISPGDTIIATEPQVKTRIESNFGYKVLRQYYNVVIYEILQPQQLAGSVSVPD